jgi:hypothetical protein
MDNGARGRMHEKYQKYFIFLYVLFTIAPTEHGNLSDPARKVFTMTRFLVEPTKHDCALKRYCSRRIIVPKPGRNAYPLYYNIRQITRINRYPSTSLVKGGCSEHKQSLSNLKFDQAGSVSKVPQYPAEDISVRDSYKRRPISWASIRKHN